MSFPNIPDVDATIDVSTEEAANLLLASIAFEELGLAHLINAEAEKIQYVLGTIEGQTPLAVPATIEDLLTINASADQVLRDIIKKEMLLQFKLENVLTIGAITISTTTTSTTSTDTTTTEEPVEVGSAWSVGTDFGNGNAQYTSIEPEEGSKTVDLGLGRNHIDIGSVSMVRDGDNLIVTVSTVSPFVMSEVQVYVSDEIPTNSAPGQFPYKFEVTQPEDFFTSHSFTIDVSAFAGETIYVAAHAKVFEVG